ncbi:MAG: hypothetical protein WCO78_00230 [Candidatus Roizmanbacteria bacterium]
MSKSISVEFRPPDLARTFTDAIQSNPNGDRVDDIRAKHVAVITSSFGRPIEGNVVIFQISPKVSHLDILDTFGPLPTNATIDAGYVCLDEGEEEVRLDGESTSIGINTVSKYRGEIEGEINARLKGTIYSEQLR